MSSDDYNDGDDELDDTVGCGLLNLNFSTLFSRYFLVLEGRWSLKRE